MIGARHDPFCRVLLICRDLRPNDLYGTKTALTAPVNSIGLVNRRQQWPNASSLTRANIGT